MDSFFVFLGGQGIEVRACACKALALLYPKLLSPAQYVQSLINRWKYPEKLSFNFVE